MLWHSGWVDGESSSVVEADLTVLKEDGRSFVEAQNHCVIGRCHNVTMCWFQTPTRKFRHVAWLMPSKNHEWRPETKIRVASGRLNLPQPIHKCMLSITLYKKYVLLLLTILLRSVCLFARKVIYMFKILVITIHFDIWALLCLCFREKEAILVHQVQRWEIY